MSISITCNRKFYREGLPLPIFSATGQNGNAKWYIRDNVYKPVSGSFEWQPKNRTDFLDVSARDLILSTFTGNGGLNNSNNNFSKQSGYASLFNGASATGIASGNTSIEGAPNVANSAIALQSQNTDFDYVSSLNIGHSMVFLPDETGAIVENGVDKEYFSYVLGDSGLIELVEGVVRYWLVKATGEMVLIRSTRSTLLYPIYPTVILYSGSATLNNVRVWNGNVGSLIFQTFGILKNFQDWQNQGQLESLAEKTMTKDKVEKFTYFTEEKSIQTISVNLEWRDEDEYFNFVEFYKYHDLSKEFIFADYARKKFAQSPSYTFMRFVSAFTDNPLGSGLFGVSCDVREVLKSQHTLLHNIAKETMQTQTFIGFRTNNNSIIFRWPESFSYNTEYELELFYDV